MRTIDGKFTTSTSIWSRVWRDARLLVRLGKQIIQYWTVGFRIRRSYRKKEARGEVFWLD